MYKFSVTLGFSIWKEEMENEISSTYVLCRGEKAMKKKKGFIRKYYVCHRSYKLQMEKTNDRKRRMKSSGTNKIGAACPSIMIVDHDIRHHKFFVEFTRSHVGHSCDVIRNRLSATDRDRIAGM